VTVQKRRKPIHPKVKAGAAGGGAAAAVVAIAAWAGLDLPFVVAEAVIILASFVGGYLKSE
jgi:hypothetical protein